MMMNDRVLQLVVAIEIKLLVAFQSQVGLVLAKDYHESQFLSGSEPKRSFLGGLVMSRDLTV